MADEDSDAQSAVAYKNNIWDDDLPAPTGNLTKKIEKICIAVQKDLAISVFQYLANVDSNLTQLNAKHRLYTALLNIPNSNSICIIYGLGFGSSGIGITSPIDNKLLTMSGEGDTTIGVSHALVLSISCIDFNKLHPQNEITFQTTLSTNKTSWHHAKINAIKTAQEISVMQVAPIPTFLVYDGFNKDLEAEEIYERLLSVNEQENDMIKHAKKFLRACTVPKNAPDANPFCQSKQEDGQKKNLLKLHQH